MKPNDSNVSSGTLNSTVLYHTVLYHTIPYRVIEQRVFTTIKCLEHINYCSIRLTLASGSSNFCTKIRRYGR